MKQLKTYLEDAFATSANTVGMGNPGEIGPDTLSEPIATAKSEVEKDKKKKKKKMKSLIESLFDDNIKKDVFFGEILELEAWECASLEDYSAIGPVLDSTFSAKRKNKLIKLPKWKKFLSPLESIYNKPFSSLNVKQQYEYISCWQFWTFTWVVMCCHSLKEIPIKLNEFMKEISRDINDEDVFDEDFYIKKIDVVPLEGLREDMKGMPRLVVVQFKIKGREIVTYMKLKKRDL